jgi:signal transduction histidine kinase/CheY-like chemotaxis protein
MDVASGKMKSGSEVLALMGRIMGRERRDWTRVDLEERLADPDVERFLQRAQFQRQLENAVAVTGKLAHDFGNILTGILGFAELSLNELPADSPARRYLQEIANSAENGAVWNRKLQDFCRKSDRRGQAIHLAQVLAALEDRFGQGWGKRVSFLLAVPADLPAVAMDGASLRQLVGKLLDNAGEAAPDGGVVTLSAKTVEVTETACLELLGCAQPGSHVEITITDTGAGLSEETQQRLFRELFFSTKARRRGLGLAVVINILVSCQGGLSFGPGAERGTTVRVYLPVAGSRNSGQWPVVSGQCAILATDHRPLATDRGGRVLVVDDDPLVLGMVCQILAQAGFQTQAAAGPDEAVALCHAAGEPFRLIVSDIVMPGMNGFEMVRQLQTQGITAKVLFISSQPGNGPAADELLTRYPLLHKPFRANDLVEAAAAALAPASQGNPKTQCVSSMKEVLP